MELRDKVVVVTGGASGIGRALCERFAAEGARGVVVADRDKGGAKKVAAQCGGLAITTDVGVAAELTRLVEETTAAFGPIDLFCSNAGIGMGGGIEVPTEQWQRIWDVNVMAHVYAARAVLPGMIARVRLLAPDGFGRRSLDPDRLGPVFGHEACRGRARRVAVDHLRSQRNQGVVRLSPGGRHRDAPRQRRAGH